MIDLLTLLSWVLYVSIFLAAGLSVQIGLKTKRRRYIALAIAFPTLLGGLRYAVGTDYASYIEKLELLSSRSVVDYFTSSLSNIFEPTFFTLAHVSFHDSTQAVIFFLLMSLVTVGFLCLGSLRYSKKYAGILFFLLLTTVFPRSLNGVRQGVATAICFYAVSYIPEKRPVRYVLLVLLAGLFHYSALIMLPVYLLSMLSNVKLPRISDKYGIIRNTTIALGSFGLIAILVKNIAKIPFIGRYSYLVSPEALALASSPNILMKVIPVAVVVPFYKRLVEQDAAAKFYMLLSMIAVSLSAIGYLVRDGHRLADYFMPFYAILFVGIVELYKGKPKYRKIAIGCILAYGLLYFTGSFLLRGSHDLFPYQFIFLR